MDPVSPDRWPELDALFAAALDRPPEERDAFLRKACGEDEALYHDVVALLVAADSFPFAESAADQAPDLLAGLAAEDEADADRDDLSPGSQVGAYRIVREIGRGGMGAVYLAERADGAFKRQGALKLVKRGLDTDEILRRFRYERQILAGLDHPNIARLYDAGATEDGRPYLVLEYVDGRPINAHCEAHGLAVRARVELMRRVCRAVDYAHRNLVVHRDLKPSNILVTADGTVKLLDFGIAKLLAPDPELTAPQTRAEVRILTPEYAAPEQLQGEPVTTATDVYALGVTLNRLLTGRQPEDSATWPGRLPKDLDRILAKALDPDPDRRYPSAAALDEDLRRHLAGEPVTARGDSVAYRLGRFVRRHKAGVAAAAVVLLSLVGGLGAALWQADRAARERDAAEQVAAFLEELFTSPDPFDSGDERLDTLRLREFLALGTERVRADLVDQPVMHARMMGVLGRVHRNLGLLDESQLLLEEALAARLAAHGPRHPDVRSTQRELALLLTRTGEYDEAEGLFRSVLDQVRGERGLDAELASTLQGLGDLLRRRGEYDEAERLIREAIDIRRRTAQGDDGADRLAGSLGNLAHVLQMQGRYDEAEALYREAVEINRGARHAGHPAIANALTNLATVLVNAGRPVDAEPVQREALEIYRAALGGDHPAVASALNTMGSLLGDLRRYDEAEPLLREAMEIRRRIFGDAHPEIASAVNNLAHMLNARGDVARGDLARAESLFRESLEIRRRIHEGEHVDLAVGLNNLASNLRRQGRLEEAEPLQREALEMFRRVFGPDHPAVAIAKNNLGEFYRDLGNLDAAIDQFQKSIAIYEATVGPENPRTLRTRVRLGTALAATGAYDEAERHLLEALPALEEQGDAARALEPLVALYAAWGRPAEEARFRTMLEEASQPTP